MGHMLPPRMQALLSPAASTTPNPALQPSQPGFLLQQKYEYTLSTAASRFAQNRCGEPHGLT
jgi:hypothetical protein